MSWPKGRPRPKKVGSEINLPPEYTEMLKARSPDEVRETFEQEFPVALNTPPADWRKGALLNVRNMGSEMVITLWPEEASANHPERSLRFTNFGEAQTFVSTWYSNEHHDPRAR
jgi:hypothetical protein